MTSGVSTGYCPMSDAGHLALANMTVLPVALPMAAAVVLVLTRRQRVVSRVISMTANLAGLVAAFALVRVVAEEGIQVLAFGGWKAPFGIVFAVDMLGALMVAVTMVVSTATLLFACFSMDKQRETHFFYPLFQFLLMGTNGAFLTGDLFNLFVWFEVLLLASYGLMALGGRPYQLQETFKYLVINALASALFLVGIAVVYALCGTLNMADLHLRLADVGSPALRGAVALLFMVVFGVKAGVFPLYMWLPRSYFAPPAVVSALFGGLLTKVGVYALFRMVTLVFAEGAPFTLPVLVVVAAATMFFGVIGALSQWDFKRILSYHIISQVGYMIMGLAIFTPLALAGGIFYIVHHIMVKTALFLVAGVVERKRGTTFLSSLGGVLETAPVLTALFVVAGLSLAGVPPLSGFVAKLMLVKGGLEAGSYGVVSVSVVVSFLTLFSMMKVYRYVFWGVPRGLDAHDGGEGARVASVLLLVGLGVILGLGAGWAMPYAELAAHQLLDTEAYVAAVLGGRL